VRPHKSLGQRPTGINRNDEVKNMDKECSFLQIDSPNYNDPYHFNAVHVVASSLRDRRKKMSGYARALVAVFGKHSPLPET